MIEYQGDIELDMKTIHLPFVPVSGKENFDVIWNDKLYNFSVIDIDTKIVEGNFEHITIYVK
jgi:hypothetical protein